MKRWAVLAIALLLLPAGQAFASDATPAPVVVASPTAEGCDQLGPYTGELHHVATSVKALWGKTFPGVPFIDQMTDEESDRFIFGATPKELRAFAAFFDEFLGQLEAVDAPPVAEAFHRQHIQGGRLIANMLRESATLGVFVAAITYMDMIDESDALEDALAQAALAVCPAFQRVIDFYDDNPVATPAASPAR